jgi:hypothetical protein
MAFILLAFQATEAKSSVANLTGGGGSGGGRRNCWMNVRACQRGKENPCLPGGMLTAFTIVVWLSIIA